MKKMFLKHKNTVLEEINSNTFNLSFDAFKFVQNYIFEHPNDHDVLVITNYLIERYKDILLNNNFINALKLNDDLRYLKRQEIQKNLPFLHTNNYYINYLFKTFVIPNKYYGTLTNFYNGLFYFLKEHNSCPLNDEQIKYIITFLENNKTILNINTNHYDSLNDEIIRYKNICLNRLTDDFSTFEQDKKALAAVYNHYYEGNIMEDYKNKKLGIIGELYTFENLKQFMNSCFISRDLGDGFGYDIYFQNIQNNTIYENLIEVKTTTNINGNDYFSLSENEYNTIIQSQKYGNVNYYIGRIFADILNDNFSCNFLKLENNCFKSLDTSLEYEYINNQNNCYYFSNKQKSKTLTK